MSNVIGFPGVDLVNELSDEERKASALAILDEYRSHVESGQVISMVLLGYDEDQSSLTYAMRNISYERALFAMRRMEYLMMSNQLEED